MNDVFELAKTRFADKLETAKTEHGNDSLKFYSRDNEAYYTLNDGEEQRLYYDEFEDAPNKIYYSQPRLKEYGLKIWWVSDSGNSKFHIEYYEPETIRRTYGVDNYLDFEIDFLVFYKLKV